MSLQRRICSICYNKRAAIILLFYFCFSFQFSYSQSTTFYNTSTGPFGTIQTWTVPSCVTSITIEAWGAQGGGGNAGPGGQGAYMKGTFSVTPGQILKILVGQQGTQCNAEGGGGGGTFITDSVDNPLIIAGGGGGSSQSSVGSGGTSDTCGLDGDNNGAKGGCNGNGGDSGADASSGGGLITDGGNSGAYPCSNINGGGKSFIQGGDGGTGSCCTTGANGGFGGGGGTHGYIIGGGGAGGYGGGGGGSNGNYGGGGGGSYNGGTNQLNSSNVNAGHGKVVITILSQASLSTSFTSTNLTCNGVNDGTATVSAGGGTLPYSYLWSNGQTDANCTGLSSGSYILTVTDANNCFTISTVTITEPPPLSVSLSTTPTGCVQSNGTATANVTGGTFPYYYLWSDGQTDATVSGLSSGKYTLTITDSNGCSDSIFTTITGFSSPTIQVSSLTNATCYGQSDGSVSISVSGAFPFTYTWSPNGETNSTVTGLSAGIYKLTVTDSNGCTQTASVAITEPSPLVLNFKRNYYTCAEGSGMVQLTASGGTNYSWSPSAGLSDTTIANPLANPIINTTYIVTVSNGLCSDTAHVTVQLVSPPSPPLINQNGDTLIIPQTYVSYQWYYEGGPITGASNYYYITTQSGHYSVYVTDSVGCRSVATNVYVINEVGYQLALREEVFIVYPNPVLNEIWIECDRLKGKNIKTTFYNLFGEKAYSKDYDLKTTQSEMRIDVSFLKKGVYLISIETEHTSTLKKFIKQ